MVIKKTHPPFFFFMKFEDYYAVHNKLYFSTYKTRFQF